jgi:hypothetical protein
MVQVRLVLLPLLVLQPVFFQLNNKVNNYFSSRLTNFRTQITFILSSS